MSTEPDGGARPGPVHLHVGLPKTGTTYLQSLLWPARDRLRGQGLLLPGFGPREHLWASGDVRQEPRLARRHPDAPGAWTRLADELGAWTGRGLVSHEFFCGATAEQAQAMVDSLGDREVHVVVTAREIVGLVTARWQEWVKNGNTGPLEAYPETTTYRPADEWGWGTLDLGDVLRRWGRAVPHDRLHVICPPADGEPRDELWRRFAAVVGLDPSVVDPATAAANESLGVVEVELLRRVNAELAEQGGFSRAVERGRWIRGYLAQERLVPLGGDRFWPAPSRVEELRRRGEAALEELTGGGYHVVGSTEVLRTPTVLPERRHPDEVSDDELVTVSSRLVAAMLVDVRAARSERSRGESSGSPGQEPVRGSRGVRRLRRLWHPGRADRSERTDR